MVIAKELKSYCEKRLSIILAIWIVFVALFGMWMFHDMVTFDAEGFYSFTNGEKWYLQWLCDLNRWGFVGLKHVLGVVAINPYFSCAIFFVFFPLSTVLWGFVLSHWSGNEQPKWVLFVFATLLISFPVWAQQFAYRNQIEVMSLALTMLPVGLLLFGEFLENRNIACGIAALAIATFEFGCYQSFIFMYVEGLCILLFLRMRREAQLNGRAGAAWRDMLTCICFVVASFALYWVISKVIQIVGGASTEMPEYLSEQFFWGKRRIVENIGAILSNIALTSFGDGENFVATFGITAIGLVCMLVHMLVRRSVQPAYAILVVLGILVAPFLLHIATAGEIVVRSQLAVVIAAAFLGTYELETLSNAMRPRLGAAPSLGIVVAAALVFVFAQAQMQTRLLYSDVVAMDEDRENMEQIYYQAMAMGAHEDDAVCFVGDHAFVERDTTVASEVVAYSYFEVAKQKTVEGMQAYGYHVSNPTPEQMQAADLEAPTMQVWPTGGSIKVHDGYFVVRLS